VIRHMYKHIVSLLFGKGSAYLVSHMHKKIIPLLWCKEAASILLHTFVFTSCGSFDCYRKQSYSSFDIKIDVARKGKQHKIKIILTLI
jgi:hypothetical protein